MESLFRLIHTPLYGEMLLAIAVLGIFASIATSTQPEVVSLLVRRCTLAAFGIYVAIRIVSDGVSAPGTLITYAFRGFVAAGLTYCFCGFAFTVVAVVLGNGILPAKRWIAKRLQDLRFSREQRRDEERRRQTEHADAWARHERKMDREREDRIAAEAKAIQDAERAAREQALEKARFQARVFYDTLPEETRKGFSLDQLHQYFDEFVHAELAQEEITERVAKLREMLTDRVRARQGPFGSLDSIVKHFDQQREDVLQAGLTPDQTDSLLTDLEADKARAIRDLKERIS